jgi:hypothetical protein
VRLRSGLQRSVRQREQSPASCVSVGVEDLLLALLEPLLEILGEALLDIGEAVLQPFFDLAAGALRGLIQAWTIGPVTLSIGLLLVGAAIGLLSAFLVPHRLIGMRVALPGISLLLAPLVTGSAMYFSGKRLRRFEWLPSNLAGFRGGAAFAFSMALIRWWFVGLHH